ncbi:asparagine synthetase [hydrocarbon metagenome]|uniref:Asparagine synthetase n=1 Tax=hydrocarbon metagenome TaxID=938273 RepID=A0A0W8E5H4_9ZZZZ
MCGIAGWISWNTDLREADSIIERMSDTLQNRGPDAKGVWSSRHAALGHRRLIIVDPEGGKQPMVRIDRERIFVITYNGELYNTLELRRDLEKKGHVFYSRNSDTEVILTAYIEWGVDCVERFNGIYAFGIWNEEEQSLFLARDRLGVKPLFYHLCSSQLLFASEPKAILIHPALKAEVDQEGLAEILFMGPSRTPGHGIFKGMKELKPGSWMLYKADHMMIKKYWSLKSFIHNDSLDDTAERLRDLFCSSVKKQLIADRTLCTMLSGGLDSSAITAVAAGVYTYSHDVLHTFSVDYADNARFYMPNQFETSSDNPWIQQVSNFLHTRHNSIVLDNRELAATLEPALLANDMPDMTDINSSLYLFCREVKNHAAVALSGECADEILGGYPWFHDADVIKTRGFPWIRMLPERSRFLSSGLQQHLTGEDYVREKYLEAIKEVPALEGEPEWDARMREISYLNITRFMQTLLDRKDRMSMANGLEVRVPFADHELVQYVWNIPWQMKNYGGMAKGILRKALTGILPAPVLERRKSPYPKTHNPLYAEEVKKELLRVLDAPSAAIQELINKDIIRYHVERGRPFFEKPWFSQLMGDIQYMAYLLQINRWLENYQVNILL